MKRQPIIYLTIALVFLAGCANNGDRVLVFKAAYDAGLGEPNRYDVVVFRYPDEPIEDQTPTNYIKRLLGLAGETIAIFFGQLYRTTALEYPDDGQPPPRPEDLWKKQYTHFNDPRAADLFKQGEFEILRKPPDVMLALRRIVYDNDHPAEDLQKSGFPDRWRPAAGAAWQADERGFTHPGEGDQPQWLIYRHILRPEGWPREEAPNYGQQVAEILKREQQPQLITDFMGYNSHVTPLEIRADGNWSKKNGNWVGDLMLEFELQVDRPEGELWVDLAEGVDRFQARWDLSTGTCKLVRLQTADGKAEETVLDTKPTPVSAAGKYSIKFANFDDRLTLWVNRDLPFGEGVAYKHAWSYSPTGGFENTGPTENDLEPAKVGSRGAAVEVRHLKLWRDTYYTRVDDHGHPVSEAGFGDASFWSDPARWERLRNPEPTTMFVQPGHYLCLGDNSPESSDSRSWGLVPQRLMLGRALIVYWPYNRIRLIH